MEEIPGRLDSCHSGDWEDAWDLPLEESEDAGDCQLESVDSREALKKSHPSDRDGYLNGSEDLPDGRTSPAHERALIERPRDLKITRSAFKIESGNSSLHRSSCSSIDSELAGLDDRGGGNSISRLKPVFTSPAALNTLGVGAEREFSGDNDASSRLTPTHSNFDDSQLISPSMGISYHPHTRTLTIQNDSMEKSPISPSSSFSKQGSVRKKKRSGSWYNVLSPSYRQKNEDFHKFFKDLPITERLLVDYTCALVKDILIQGRLYVSQNYLCFHSNILKWQTAVTANLVDVEQMTKEKTVKVIPNAIQVLLKDRTKMTFTSFTARDKAFQTARRLWQNAMQEKPMSASELWSQIHRNYGDELGGCSSDDDYVRPESMQKKEQGDNSRSFKYELDVPRKAKKKKKSKISTPIASVIDIKEEKAESKSSKSSRVSSRDGTFQTQQGTDSTDDEKSSHGSQASRDDVSLAEETAPISTNEEAQSGTANLSECGNNQEESDDEPSEFLMEDCAKVSLNRIYETSARNLFRIIFSDECSFWKDTLVNKGTTNINFGTWNDDVRSRGQKIRELSYTLRLDNPIGPKTSFVKETQIFYSCSVEGKSYAVDCTAQNFGIPYADYFQTCMRYCIRKLTKNTCELRISSELRYRKTPWGLVKNFLEKNVASGLNDNFRKLEYQLQERIDYEKSLTQTEIAKSRNNGNVRRRKGRSESSGLQNSTDLRNGILEGSSDNGPASDLNSEKDRNMFDDVMVGAPPLHPLNGFIPNQVHAHDNGGSESRYFTKSGRFILCAILVVFILLIYNNYCMYQRLATLELVAAAAATADGVDPSVTAALLDRPGVPTASSPEILSAYLHAIDKRLRRLEDAVEKHTKDSNAKWNRVEENWVSFHNMVEKLLSTKDADGG